MIYETLRSPDILARAREDTSSPPTRLSGCSFLAPPEPSTLSSPFLQSLYAETLRLYSAALIMHSPNQRDIRLKEWLISRGNIVTILNYTAHRDESVWTTGSEEDPHPLDEFWAERFLVDPNNRRSGPSRQGQARNQQHKSCISARQSASTGALSWGSCLPISSPPRPPSPSNSVPTPVANVHFSLDGLAGAWIPYGAGMNICPRRHFAKQEVMLTLALIVSNFDIELIGRGPRINWSTFGTGVLSPKGRTRCRIKRRRK